ncbi:FHA domain-containing protein [Arthrobacter sp. LAPM80]|uniref:FHA domain-containing protein n=1 Tax=Arthrobacter sp. LAPM80 TaxID=3141788 RepID=UPI00398B089C
MVSTTYTTGSWLGIVRSGSIIVLDGHTDPSTVGELWDFLGQEPTIHGVLNAVTEKFGTSLTGMPDFAIVVQSDRLHAILRGDITLLAHTPQGIEMVSGRDVTTWSERSLQLSGAIEMAMGEPASGSEAIVLPLGEAVVRLRALAMAGASTAATVEAKATHDGGLPTPVPGPPAPGVLEEPADQPPAPEEAEPQETTPEEDAWALAEFAMAAEAADAEWNAQLAPLDVPHPDADEPDVEHDAEPYIADDGAAEESPELQAVEADMNLTMRPETGDDADDDADDQAASEPDPFEYAAPAGAEAVDEGFTTNYDFLFGDTLVGGSVENAAVRLDEDGQPISQAPLEHSLPPLPPLPPSAGHIAKAVDTAVAEPEPAETAPEGLLIDSVPWDIASAQPEGAPEDEQAPAAQQATQQEDTAYDPDHDGHTVMRSGLLRDGQPAPETVASRPPTGPMVLARVCPNGHANPPSHSQCSDCGAMISSEPREVGRPRLGTMHISTGEVIELDHSLIIGRQPSVSRVMGGAMPRLVQVKSGNGDISRSHVEVRLDGWDVLLVDLKATNGTVLVREGQMPRRLSQGEEAILLNGDIAELGDGVSLLFDGLL